MSAKQRFWRAAMLTCAAALSACIAQGPDFKNGLPPLSEHIACLPENAAIISAHRGTARRSGQAENSLSGLRKLMRQGIIMAEIDVARTRDGVHFLYHDGVWEKGSTGKGAVAASRSVDLENILLRLYNGQVTSERPPLFSEVLALAKDRLYLEIDFKSSANARELIGAIRSADMANHVVLITYSKKQANQIAALAPDMLLSVPPSAAERGRLIWVGKDVTQTKYAKPLKNMQEKRYLGKVGRPDRQQGLSLAKRRSAILVTDYANLYLPITGLTRKTEPAYQACLDSAEAAP